MKVKGIKRISAAGTIAEWRVGKVIGEDMKRNGPLRRQYPASN